MSGYRTLEDAYRDGWSTFDRGEPDNLWSPWANHEEAMIWRQGWKDAAALVRAEEAFEREAQLISKSYREHFERERERMLDELEGGAR